MTERLHFCFSLSCIEEGNGHPLQCSCLENPRDRGAWWAAVSGVAQSRTRLKQLSSSNSEIQTEEKQAVGMCFISFFLSIWFSFLLARGRRESILTLKGIDTKSGLFFFIFNKSTRVEKYTGKICSFLCVFCYSFLFYWCLVAKLCPTQGNPMDCSPPGSSVHGISQARILEWVAISSSRESSWPRDWTLISCTGRPFLYHRATGEAPSCFLLMS